MKPGDQVTFHDQNSKPHMAMVISDNGDGTLNLFVFNPNTRNVELAPGAAPMTCSLPVDTEELEADIPPGDEVVAASLPESLQRPTLTSVAQDATPVPPQGETTTTEVPDGAAQG